MIYRIVKHTTIVHTKVVFHRQVDTDSWILTRHNLYDLSASSSTMSLPSDKIIGIQLQLQLCGVLFKFNETSWLQCFSLISLRKCKVYTSIAFTTGVPISSCTTIYNIMPKLCLISIYKQVLSWLSQWLATGSIPGHWAGQDSCVIDKALEIV